jgi:aspartyl-tRNA synthetase
MAIRCFTTITQIVDVTSYLPQTVATAVRHSEQTVGCLPVRRSSDTAFYPIAHECLTEDGLVSITPVPFLVCVHKCGPRQDRIEITLENMSSWLAESPIVRGFTRCDSEWVTGCPIKKLKLRPGDIVWIGKQRDRPEVKAFVHSFLAC